MIMVEYFQTYDSETNGLNCKNVDYRIFVQEKWESYSSGWAQLVAQTSNESPSNAGDLGLISGLGRSPGEWNGYPLQYSYLENI